MGVAFLQSLIERVGGLWTRIEAATHRAWWTGPRIAVAAILTLAGVHVAVVQPRLGRLPPRHRRAMRRERRLAWTPLDEIAPEAVEAIANAEDRRFRDHDGVDWWAVAGSIRDRIGGKRARGASTLSMQVAG